MRQSQRANPREEDEPNNNGQQTKLPPRHLDPPSPLPSLGSGGTLVIRHVLFHFHGAICFPIQPSSTLPAHRVNPMRVPVRGSCVVKRRRLAESRMALGLQLLDLLPRLVQKQDQLGLATGC